MQRTTRMVRIDSKIDMSMKKIQLLLIAVLLLPLVACDEIEGIQPVFTEQEEGNPKNIFASPVVGMINYYTHFSSDIAYDKDRYLHSNIQYNGDTLMLEVIEKTDTGYLVRESYTPGSATPSKVMDPNGFPPITFMVSPTAKGWEISAGESRLFLSYNKTFTLPEDDKEEFDTIRTYPESVELDILGKTFSNLSLSYNYGPMAYDGHGHQWFITDQNELPRIAFVSAMIPLGEGWDWIQ